MPTATDRRNTRARILDTAYELFSQNGIRAVGVDQVVAESQVAKMTLYRHFASKDDLVLAFLHERIRRWAHGWLEVTVDALAERPTDRLLAIFDALDAWFHQPDYEGCAVIRTLLEIPSGPLHQAAAARLEEVRAFVVTCAEQAGARDPEMLSHQIQILMMGAIVSALRGDREAGRRAQEVAVALLATAR